MKKRILFTLIIGLAGLQFAYAQDNRKNIGVLVLAHGGNEQWNETIAQAAEPLKKNYTVEVAYGMADPHSMQKGINNLEEKGIDTIVAVQLFVSSYSVIIRQNEYLLGYRKELADEPMVMMHGEEQMKKMAAHYLKKNDIAFDPEKPMKKMTRGDWGKAMDEHRKHVEIKPLNINARVLLTEPLDDHPLVESILVDRIKELSADPKRETVILVAHGPNGNKDNMMWLNTLQKIATQMKSAFGPQYFRAVTYMTLRDDARKEVYDSAKQAFRKIVKVADEDNGRALIVPILMSKGGIEKRLQKRLKGLDYIWNGHTLLPDNKIGEWMKVSVEQALARQKEALSD